VAGFDRDTIADLFLHVLDHLEDSGLRRQNSKPETKVSFFFEFGLEDETRQHGVGLSDRYGKFAVPGRFTRGM